MPNDIPTVKREQVTRRDLGRCVRCGMPGREKHHRRRKRVLDQHQHCSCNLVNLCRKCHVAAHQGDQIEARNTGFRVSHTVSDPSTIPVRYWNGEMITLDCEGGFEFVV